MPDLRQQIAEGLLALRGEFSRLHATDLLATLGYQSELTGEGGSGADFLDFYPLPPGVQWTQKEKELLESWQSAHLLFQFTKDEISGQMPMAAKSAFDGGNLRSFVFVAVNLKPRRYARGAYAAMTRAVNKCFAMPAVLLFRNSGKLTLAFMPRREDLRRPGKNILGKVSLLREIDLEAPHRAHLEILQALSLKERLRYMRKHNKSEDFDGLLAAWLAELDTEELNKRFYKELFRWFERAVKKSKFPSPAGAAGHAVTMQQHIIRLITRMLFIWFIKEKGLVSEDLFDEEKIRPLLREWDPEDGANYYTAILQNLFFATLNTSIGKRKFSAQGQSTHRNFNLYRYADQLLDKARLLKLMKHTPFINGGLFDCLDSFETKGQNNLRVDCFTDNKNQRKLLRVPNNLFFGTGGLLPLLKRFKFTVQENTPIEQEVALDPELLGRAFENLLAAYNPETSNLARNQTGSFYTPRDVVDYMVNEALVAHFAAKITPADGDRPYWEERLRDLLSYEIGEPLIGEPLIFPKEKRPLVQAVAATRVLDPAVGSGAFSMSVLHKLELLLERVDPDNALWEEIQKERAREAASAAFDRPNRKERDARLLSINDTFERFSSQFGRKLYLIQNSIYGVDIQSIATQIAKLRFFITLAIEQQPNENERDNYGIRPLPNLETRFVAADALLGLSASDQKAFGDEETLQLTQQIEEIRERFFSAATRSEKMRCREADEKARKQLSKKLSGLNFPKEDARRIAAWDPYDQNATADWFDAERMLGVHGGFDIVIGNPPYIQLQKQQGRLADLYEGRGYETFVRTGDIYQLFYEKGCDLLAPGGVLSYISSNSWLRAEYGKKLRGYLGEKHTPLRMLEMGKDVFDSAIVDTCIAILRQGKSGENCRALDMDSMPNRDFPPALDDKDWGKLRLCGDGPWAALSATEWDIMQKMYKYGAPLKQLDVKINFGIKTGYNAAFIISDSLKNSLIESDPNSDKIIKPVLRGRDIQRYRAQWANLWLIATLPSLNLNIEKFPAVKKHLLTFGKSRLEQSGKRLADGTKARKKTQHQWFELQDACAYHGEFAKKKIVWIELAENGRFAYDNSGIYCEASSFMMTGNHLKYICALLNSKLIRWFLQRTAPTSGMGTLRWKKIYIEAIPIPQIPKEEQHPIINLVNQILQAKDATPPTDTTALEAQVDDLVHALYHLTPQEIALIAP